jgi:antitoxin component YwqK of YwqJK toxin-antitoxin module
MQTWYPSGQLRITQQLYAGREEALMRSYYENGNREAQRFYRNGEKDSVHRGWWLNGQLQYEYHYRNGEYEGDFKEWYPSGSASKHIAYHQGKEQWGKGWRENGKPYMSFVMRDGRLYGLINPNLCYSLKNERGEYVENSAE